MTSTALRPSGAANRTPVVASVRQLSQLLARAGARDEAALGDFYDATSSLVYGMALRFTGESSRAEAATTEVYLVVWRSAASFHRSELSPLAWLMALTYEQLKAVDPAA